jgi:hypothetical protein
MINKSLKCCYVWALWGFCGGLTVAWTIELHTTGYGVISRYVAPIAIIGNLIVSIIFLNATRLAKTLTITKLNKNSKSLVCPQEIVR